MPKIGYKSVKLAVTVAAGLALTTPVPAVASPPAPAAPGAPATASAPALAPLSVASRPKRLIAALLAPADLPPGYRPLVGSTGTSMMGDISTDADICDQRIATSPGIHRSETAGVAFSRDGGPMLFENLTVTGPRSARAIVAGVASAPRLCPSVLTSLPSSGQQARLLIRPLRVPRLGDAAAGVAFTVTFPALNLTVQGKMITVAYRDVATTIMLIGVPQTSPREATAIAAAAVRKLHRIR
jgi:hypothetical protein